MTWVILSLSVFHFSLVAVDTCGTICMAAETCMKEGAVEVWALATHGVLSHPAVERVNNCHALKKIIVTNTIPSSEQKNCSKLVVLDISKLLAESVDHIHNNKSLTKMHSNL